MEKEKMQKMSVSTMRVVGPGKTRDLSHWENQQKKETPPPSERIDAPPPVVEAAVPQRPRFSLPKVTIFRVQGNAKERQPRIEKRLKERLLRIKTTTSGYEGETASEESGTENIFSFASEETNPREPMRIWRSARDRMAHAGRNRQSQRDREKPAKTTTWGERVLRNCAVVSAVVLCVLALKNIDSPVTQWATDTIKGMVTAEVNIDDQLGRLQFVQEWMPEAMQVFLATGEAEWAWPVSGRLAHEYSQSEPWVEIVSQGQTVHAASDGEILSVTTDQRGDYVVRMRHMYGYESVYANLSGVSVQEGDSLMAGSAIGLARPEEASETLAQEGSTGIENKLYLEIRKDGVSIDPMQVFPAARRK